MATTNDWFIFKAKISRPDFYLPQYNLFVEYWGLVDSPDPGTRDNYIRTMRWKMAQYRKNNIRFISIYPSNLNSLDYNFRRKFSEAMGFKLPVRRYTVHHAGTKPKCYDVDGRVRYMLGRGRGGENQMDCWVWNWPEWVQRVDFSRSRPVEELGGET